MKSRQLIIRIALVLVIYVAGHARADWITLDYPGSSATQAYGIDGGNIVGSYTDTLGKEHGFLYDGTSWITLDYPGSSGTRALDIDGSNIVGTHHFGVGPFGFVYDGTTWTPLVYPVPTGNYGTVATGIDGGNIVGWFRDWLRAYGYIYDGTTWTIFEHPESSGPTLPQGIDGSNIVGTYQTVQPRGFLYDGTTWTTLDGMPFPKDIDGGRIIGGPNRFDFHGFLFDGTSLTSLVYPGAWSTMPCGIDGDRIVGWYYHEDLGTHGFLYQLETVIHATVNMNPHTINLQSKVKWITCYIELLEGYHVADIDVSTVTLNGEVSAESEPTAIGDYDGDGIVDLMVKFDRAAMQGILQVGYVEITVTGELLDGNKFEGSDTIKVIDKGGGG
jgi:hypothetical protein